MEMRLGEKSILKISRYGLLRFETYDTSLDKQCQILIRWDSDYAYGPK